MQVEILSPEKKVFSGEADAVQFPGTTGSFQVLNNHAAMIASLTNGTVSVKTGKETLRFRISGGFVEVLNNVLSVLVEGAEEV
ncbi:MAG TPA: ATP synthase F1 subunit epsilon [Chitinophagales bacterium]|nr:ATP synthase F1 subunit epsilon [Chitinophagales bacterium]HAE14600.1 ATP synthase F1 subunit epsilon [Bacteroidota bacterium]HPE96903.1 ATP synthase F1 subunit epsilon [Chitinophagales bacterium]HPR28178.1 ATP synthase F1 subunit epsilon [Chitinophagales bacterium]HRX23178.1 ATP synthase F1 subunit epsilon [Chitinophagales bacterium]